ncbi:alpha/beta hydrolase [Aliikangiella marina]|uniref:Alpha/beta hydrolase n=1 Tax=Aliikangiella marina TaxID=1712262 RepID=A0A545TCX0_9GAMM|nr:alpha/beta hydrolase-fold protein [Aliikangiella marina]TQV75041.1 alpha/beta hydrolase [Aliikangiella marina]
MKSMTFLITLLFITAIVVSACSEQKPRKASAADNVFVLDKIFEIPGLNRHRKIRIYLPPNYQASIQSYPVLYMHDGQNLFDDATSYAGEWGIDEALNQLHQSNGLSLIVVGIDNGEVKRMNELSPWPNQDYGDAEGEAYMQFIIDVVKPFIDSNYRTLSDAKNTAIMGSSMGGLISHYAAFEYPSIFSKIGIFSPSYWFSDSVFVFSDIKKLTAESKLYMLMGGEEGDDMVENFKKMRLQLKSAGLTDENLSASVVPAGEHNEAFWRSEFKRAILWLFQ